MRWKNSTSEQSYPYNVDHATGDWKKDIIKLAKELEYSDEVIQKLKDSTDENQANRIMRTARLGKKNANVSGYAFLNY